MKCCQCQGIESQFNAKQAAKELKDYRRRGPRKSTRILIEALGAEGVKGMTTMPHMLFQVLFLGAWVSITGSKKVGAMGTVKVNKDDLSFMGDLLEDGKEVPVIDRHYTLGEVAEAIRYLEKGHARGKVVITV